MPKLFKAIVNHTGSCGDSHYEMGKETLLPEDVIKALGKRARVIGAIEEKVEEKEEEKPEVKEAKKPLDKMVRKEDAKTK